MIERRAAQIDKWANVIDRLEKSEKRLKEAEAKIAELSGRPNGKTDEEIMDVFRKEVGAGTIAFFAKLVLWICGAAGTALLAYLGVKGVSAK